MSVNTFVLTIDPENNQEYIYQKIDKADKNHLHKDTHKSNQGCIYALPGKIFIFPISKIQVSQKIINSSIE